MIFSHAFIADEEIGGKNGMFEFVKTEMFKKMNVGFALDEGYANPTEKFTVFYGERAPWCECYSKNNFFKWKLLVCIF